MLGYKQSYKVFTVVLIFLLIVNLFVSIPFWFMLIPVLCFISLIVFGSARINSGFFMNVICNGNRSEKSIAITFDDGPVPGFTLRILDILKKTGTSATFFCIGKNIRLQPELVKKIDQDGHLLGNHSYSHHFFFDFYSTSRIKSELKETNDLVKEITNKNIQFFRPPYGVTTPNIAKAVESSGFRTIGWSVRSMDTVISDKEQLLKRATRNIKPGDIVLFHDTVESTVLVLQEFIEHVREQGYKIVRLDHLLKLQAYA